LKKYYLKRVGKQSQARDEIEKMFKYNPEKLRCVTCNLKSLEVEEKKQRAGVSKQPTSIQA
jgi:ribosomal protein S6